MLNLTKTQRRALTWFNKHKRLSEFTDATPSFQTVRELREQGLVCDRLLEVDAVRANCARVVYRATWLGRAALKRAL